MKKAKITEEHSDKIHSLISVKTFTWQDISNVFDNIYTINQIQYHVRKYYPELKGNIKKEYSKGGTKLEYLLKQIFPASKVKAEVSIGDRLRVDFIVGHPYNIAFEFDGSQHETYTPHFHGSLSDFNLAQQRDERKAEILLDRGVSLIRISQLSIDESTLIQMIENVGYGSGLLKESALTYKEKLKIKVLKQRKQAEKLKKKRQKEYNKTLDNSYAEAQKERQREHRKAQYQRQKEWLKKNKK